MPVGSLLKLILFLLGYWSQGLRRSVGPDIVDQLQRDVSDYRERSRGRALVSPSVTDSAQERLDDRGFEHVELEPGTMAPQRTSSLDEFVNRATYLVYKQGAVITWIVE